MFSFSIKLDVSLSSLALVVIGSVASYGISLGISKFIRSHSEDGGKDVSEKQLIEYPPMDCTSKIINETIVQEKNDVKSKKVVIETSQNLQSHLKASKQISEVDPEQHLEDEVGNSHDDVHILDKKEGVREALNVSDEQNLNELSNTVDELKEDKSYNQINQHNSALSRIIHDNKDLSHRLSNQHDFFYLLWVFVDQLFDKIEQVEKKFGVKQFNNLQYKNDVEKSCICVLQQLDNKQKFITKVKDSELMSDILSSIEDIVKFGLQDFQNTKLPPQLNEGTKRNIICDMRDYCEEIKYMVCYILEFLGKFTATSDVSKEEVVATVEDWNIYMDTPNYHFNNALKFIKKATKKVSGQCMLAKFANLSKVTQDIVNYFQEALQEIEKFFF